MDSLAVSYAGELARFGIETSIVVPGVVHQGTNHFAHSGRPDDAAVAAAYEEQYAGLMDRSRRSSPTSRRRRRRGPGRQEIARVVALPAGQRPFRVHIDPADDGSERVSEVADRVRTEFLPRIELDDLLPPGARAGVEVAGT